MFLVIFCSLNQHICMEMHWDMFTSSSIKIIILYHIHFKIGSCRIFSYLPLNTCLCRNIFTWHPDTYWTTFHHHHVPNIIFQTHSSPVLSERRGRIAIKTWSMSKENINHWLVISIITRERCVCTYLSISVWVKNCVYVSKNVFVMALWAKRLEIAKNVKTLIPP